MAIGHDEVGILQVVRRWETNDRYYEVHVENDLFGERILTTFNGGLNTNLGCQRVVAVGEDIDPAIKLIAQRRKAHKYQEVPQDYLNQRLRR